MLRVEDAEPLAQEDWSTPFAFGQSVIGADGLGETFRVVGIVHRCARGVVRYMLEEVGHPEHVVWVFGDEICPVSP